MHFVQMNACTNEHGAKKLYVLHKIAMRRVKLKNSDIYSMSRRYFERKIQSFFRVMSNSYNCVKRITIPLSSLELFYFLFRKI